ncbi:hypothetical protein HPB48_024651 [Haemaphysalis longicornis]|uniref:Uncharacterized protein n=1 Tax=Haemaphysalis longicornis TaxID=44386 RepID=A0A9J6H8W0_HAELO|nr:hypothetical protein HPB48_024651 [Haemaphysalis longicornis]
MRRSAQLTDDDRCPWSAFGPCLVPDGDLGMDPARRPLSPSWAVPGGAVVDDGLAGFLVLDLDRCRCPVSVSSPVFRVPVVEVLVVSGLFRFYRRSVSLVASLGPR